MKTLFASIAVLPLLGLFSVSAPSGKVSVKGVHLCCGGCQSAAKDAFDGLKGVSNISVDLNTKVISFTVDKSDKARSVLKTLAEAGFYGTATMDGKPVKYPDSGAGKGARSNSLTLTGLHLCCTSCVTGSQKALQGVRGVSLIDIDRNEGTIKLTGDAISHEAAVGALHKAGFACSVAKEKKQADPGPQ